MLVGRRRIHAEQNEGHGNMTTQDGRLQYDGVRRCEGCDQHEPTARQRIATAHDASTETVHYCDDCAAMVNAGTHDAFHSVSR